MVDFVINQPGDSGQPGLNRNKSRVLRPRMRIKIGHQDPCKIQVPAEPDVTCLYALSADVLKVNNFSADRFKAVFALGPDQDYKFWGDFQGCSFSLEVMYENDDGSEGNWVSLMLGIADKLEVNQNRGEVTLSGRNNVSLMIATQLTDGNFVNNTVKEIVDKICAKYGITPVYDVPPDMKYGTVVGDNKTHNVGGAQTIDIKDHDVLARLAMEYGYTVIGQGDKLLFLKNAQQATYQCQAATRTYEKDKRVCNLGPTNAISLKWTHDYQMVKYDLVQTTNTNFHAPATEVYLSQEQPCEAAKHSPSYIHTINKTPEDAQTKTNAYGQHRATFEWYVEWVCSGPEYLHVQVIDLIYVSGTDSEFDYYYEVVSVEHNISFEQGMTTTITGKWGKGSGVTNSVGG